MRHVTVITASHTDRQTDRQTGRRTERESDKMRQNVHL